MLLSLFSRWLLVLATAFIRHLLGRLTVHSEEDVWRHRLSIYITFHGMLVRRRGEERTVCAAHLRESQ